MLAFRAAWDALRPSERVQLGLSYWQVVRATLMLWAGDRTIFLRNVAARELPLRRFAEEWPSGFF